MIFALHFVVWCVLARLTRSGPILENAIEPALLSGRETNDLFAIDSDNTLSTNSDLLSQNPDPLFQDSDPLFQDSDSLIQNSDFLIQDSDDLFPSDSVDLALQPFDQASAITCYGTTQNSLNLFLDDSPSSVTARDLADDIPGFNDFIAPLKKLQDSTCVAPGSSQQPKGSNGSGGDGGGQNPKNSDLQAPILDSIRQETEVKSGKCSGLPGVLARYTIPLCCDGEREGVNVHDCYYCRFSLTIQYPPMIIIFIIINK